jgi:hypothetical protein
MEKVMAKKQVSGIYILKHKSGKFYIGSTSNLYQRWASHKSLFKSGRNLRQLQTIYNVNKNIKEWKLEMLEECSKSKLKACEDKHLRWYQSATGLLNIKKTGGNVGRRYIKLSEKAGNNAAVALLGKNTKDKTIRRPVDLTFISPSGKEYPNIISIKRFAEQHGLSQPAMNMLANGQLNTSYGWTVKGRSATIEPGQVIEYWPKKRLLEKFSYETVVDPNGKTHQVFAPSQFQEQYCCTIIRRTSLSGVSKHTKGITPLGTGYRLASVPTFTLEYNGKVYTNVVSLSRLCDTIGLEYYRVREALQNPPVYKRKFTVTRN